jgi:hypothetical protein
VVTAHAVCTIAVPAGAAVLHGDVQERTTAAAQSAAITIIGHLKFAVGYEQAIEKRFEDFRFKKGRAAL